jgi:uncharacterized membrane protein
MSILDKLPVATVTFLAGLVLVIIAYISNDISFNDAYQNVLFLGGGSAAIGFARNQAGKGIRGD